MRLSFLILAILILIPAREISAITCPGSGARVRVCVTNPTDSTSPAIEVKGQAVNQQITCTGPDMLNQYGYTFDGIAAGQTDCKVIPETGNGIVSGMYVHRIVVSDTDPDQLQYQQDPVLYSASGDWVDVQWTYFPNVIEVTTLVDVGTGSLREALATANAVASETTPVLIQFAVAGELEVFWPIDFDLTAGWITIDGTDSNGNPWIVGDRNAAFAGSQDSFPVTIDLNNKAAINLLSDGNTLRGINIKNSVPTGYTQGRSLVTVDGEDNMIRAVKLDGGNHVDCLNPPGTATCGDVFDLVHIQSGFGNHVLNVEGHSGLDKGVKVTSSQDETISAHIEDGWFHHNYRGGIQATTPPGKTAVPQTYVDRTLVELSGRRCSAGSANQERSCGSCAIGNLNEGQLCVRDSDCDAMTEGDGLGTCDTDNTVVDPGANGMAANAGYSFINSAENIVRLNRNNGISARRDTASYFGFDDYSCGNRYVGLGTSAGNVSFGGTALASDGGAFVYNGDVGVALDDLVYSALLSDDNAFTQNDNDATPCDIRSDVSEEVDATNNQWRDSSPLTCGDGDINTMDVQNPRDEPLKLDGLGMAFFPSNVILEGQTIRIRGDGFNAIDGNPAPADVVGGCELGDDPTESCCLKAPAVANVCDYDGNGYVPIEGAGMCVQIYLPNGNAWFPMTVTSITPTLMVTEVGPASRFFWQPQSLMQLTLRGKVSGRVAAVKQSEACGR